MRRSANHWAWRWVLPWMLLALLLLQLGWTRMVGVDRSFGSYTRCSGCLDVGVVGHDLALAAALLLISGLALLVRRGALRGLIAILAVLLVAVYATDVVVFRLLNQRLLLSDLLKFSRELRASWSVAETLLGSAADQMLMLAAVAAPLLTATILLGSRASRSRAAVLFGLAGACALSAWNLPDPAYFLRESYRNVLEVNRPSGVDRRYTDGFIARTRQAPPLPRRCSPGAGQRRDVIVMVVESLSAYHSQLISGLLDATPKLDALAQAQGTAFANFYANGFHTDGGLIAVLGGRAPLPAINRYQSLDAFVGFERAADDFYTRLHAMGYASAFLTTASLSFLGMDRWTRALGIDHAEGGESSAYAAWPKGQFGAAEDAALIDRVLQFYDARDRARPLFLGALTVSSHPPFQHPHGGEQDELRVMRYVDAELARLHAELTQRRFFDHGALLIVGDHRSMTPLKPGEFERFGESAFARVAAFAFGVAGLPRGVETRRFQQTDLVPSLLALASDQSCRSPLQGNFLAAPTQAPEYVLHASGYEREQVQLYSDGEPAAIVLDGDASRWIGAAPRDAQALLDAVNRDRIERGALRANAFEFLIDLAIGAPSGP